MSIRVMTAVWSKAPVEGGELLLLLALADNADDRGTAYPGIPYLASKARMSDRNVQRCIRKLADAGFIAVTPNAGPGGANKYRINVQMLNELPEDFVPVREARGGDNLSPPAKCHPVTSETAGVTSETAGGDAGVTLTVIEPSEESSQGAQARERANQSVSEDIQERPSSKDERRAFQAFVNNWPGFAGMSLESAKREFAKLSENDRKAAASMRDHWIATLRKNGKDHTPVPSTYLKERLWETVSAPVAGKPADRVLAAPFGKAWTCHVLKALSREPGPLPPTSAFMAQLIDEGGAAGRRAKLDRQAAHGWPDVNRIYEAAMEGKPARIPVVETDNLPAMEALAVDSPAYHAWRCAFSDRGLPWAKAPDAVQFVWFPVGGPEQLVLGGQLKVAESA